MLTPADVGRRVVVRRRLEVVDGRQLYGDVLGDLLSWSEGLLVIRTRDGSLVSVPEADVVAGKPVPPPAAKARAPHTREALALVAATGWPAVEVEALGDWRLQAAGGFTGRANSVVPSGSPGVPLDEALDRVREFYARRGLPAWIQVVVGTPLESSLLERGWVSRASGKDAWATTEVWVCRLPVLLDRLAGVGEAAGAAGPVVEFGELDEEWERLYGRSVASSAARHVLTGGGDAEVRLARLRAPSGELVAIGRGVVTAPWLGISAIEVVPERHRRGLAQRVMAGIARWGDEAGARWAYLQFGEANAPARALYEKLGFRPDHRYRYYAPPTP